MTPCPALGRRAALAFVAAGLMVPLASMPARGAPKAEPWPFWDFSDALSPRTVDHGPWQALLERYLGPDADGINRFAYGRVTPADRRILDDYVAALAATPVRALARAEQQALWINLYNALTVRVVLAHYPVSSIREIAISPGLFAAGPWGKPLVAVEGHELTLDDIEHRILRPLWRDPRIHYALNCAALGCPNLRPAAFTADTAEAMLEAAADEFVNHPRGVRFDGDRLVVSSIYVWFRSDFGPDDQAVIGHLARYAGPALRARLAGAARVSDHAYDWRLNDRVAPNADR